MIEMVKKPDGFVVGDEMYLPTLQKFKNGEMYKVEVKRFRNPAFHRKVFAFFKFCFDHWAAEKTKLQYVDEVTQFDTFRKDLTVLAGFSVAIYTINGGVRLEPKSLAFGNMEQDEFERCYSALINAAMRTIFKDCDDEQTLAQLYSFFY